MRAIEIFRAPANEANMPAAFVNGFTDGQTARVQNQALTAYLRVGIDDYAKGYRAGFFARSPAREKSEPKTPRNVANL